MKRKKNKSTPIGQKNCHNCPAILIEPKNPQFRHYQRHGLCSACLANEIDALKEKLSRGEIINEDVEAQNLVMVTALQYYGDKRNYGILGGTRIRVDKGNRAREAMAGLSQEAGNVRVSASLYKALDEIQDLTERHHHGEGGWSNMDMCEIWTITEALLMERSKGEC